MGLRSLDQIEWYTEPNTYATRETFRFWKSTTPILQGERIYRVKENNQRSASCVRVGRLFAIHMERQLHRFFRRWEATTNYNPTAELFSLSARDFRAMLARFGWERGEVKASRDRARAALLDRKSAGSHELDGLMEVT